MVRVCRNLPIVLAVTPLDPGVPPCILVLQDQSLFSNKMLVAPVEILMFCVQDF